MKIELKHMNPSPGANSEELAKVTLARFGLIPRKKDAKAALHKLLLELYERKKLANRSKKAEDAVMTVEDMAMHSDIKRQTMYDYLNRWLMLQIIKKTTFARDQSIVIGYELNGSTLEAAFRKAQVVVNSHVETSIEVIKDLQNEIKKEKLRQGVNEEQNNQTPLEENTENSEISQN